MRRFVWLIFLFASLDAMTEQEWVKRLFAHQLIGDDLSACKEAVFALREHPESRPIWQEYIKALAKRGDEKTMMQAWNQYCSLFPEPYEDKMLVENMAWGVIGKGAQSSYPNIRLVAMLGAFFSQDAKGVEHLSRCFRDSNSLIRLAAVKLSGSLRDAKLRDEVLYCFRYEKSWEVRLEAMRALGAMQILEAKGELLDILSHQKTTAEEKACAIQSLVLMLDTAEREEVKTLATSNRAGLRLLACKAVEHFELEDDIDLIVPLLGDYHADIRAAALHAVGILRVKELVPKIERLIEDQNIQVALTAAWALTLFEPELGQKAFKRWFNHPSVEVRRFAAGALIATGKYGKELLVQAFNEAKDPFVRMNLAIGLIRQRLETDRACFVLADGFANSSERWKWNKDSFFQVLVPKGSEETNQLVRLEILNILAIMNHPRSMDAIKSYLKKRRWGITGLASVLLLTEGDDAAIDLVQEVMKDDDPKIRFQAALIVALWGRGECSIQVLQEAYRDSPREIKENIIEGLGRIGSTSSIPFLVDKLQESAQSLRLASAATLLQCLYH